MKILRCPKCGVWPATDVSIPKGVDSAGFTTVTRIVRCPGCANKLEGDPRDGAFLGALAEWKVDYEEVAGDVAELAEAEAEPAEAEAEPAGPAEDSASEPEPES